MGERTSFWPHMLNKVNCLYTPWQPFLLEDAETFLDAEECYSQIVGNALRDVPGPSGKKFIEAYMMSRVRNEWVFAIFLRLWQILRRAKLIHLG